MNIPQIDPDTARQAKARELVDYLFTNGQGGKAHRLVLMRDTTPPLDLGGWCYGAVLDAIEAAFRAVEQETRSQCAEEVERALQRWHQGVGNLGKLAEAIRRASPQERSAP